MRFTSYDIDMRVISVALLASVFALPAANAAIETRDQLKTYFETGDVPTETLDVDGNGTIDFEFDFSATGNHSVSGAVPGNGVVAVAQGSVDLAVLAKRERVDELESRLLSMGLLGGTWPGDQGFLGVRFSIAGQLHYGFLQMNMDGAGTSTPFAIHIDHSAWQSTPNGSIQTFTIPEPSSYALLSIGMLACCFVKRSR